MAADPETLGLDGLPGIVAQLGQATAVAAARVVHASLPSAAGSASAAEHYYAVAATRLEFRFLFVRKASQVLLFFHKQKTEVRPLSGTLRLQLVARDERLAPPPFDAEAAPLPRTSEPAESVRFRLRLPAFVDLSPSLEERVRYAPAGAAPESLVLFRIGPAAQHRLAIALAPALEQSRIVYFDGVRHELLSGWPARPFLDLARAIRRFALEAQTEDGPLPSEKMLDLDLSAMTPDNDAGRVIKTLVAAYLQTESALPLPPPPGTLSAELARSERDAELRSAGLLPGYEIASYRAEVQLRLSADGLIHSEGEAVVLGLRLAVRRAATGLAVELALSPPDFLITGRLFDAFVEAIRSQKPGAGFPPELQSPAAWSELVTSAQSELSIFRTRRTGEVDEDLLLLPVPRSERVLLCSLEAVIDGSAPLPRVHVSQLRLRFDSQTDADQELDEATFRYFVRLAQSLHTWTVWTRPAGGAAGRPG